MVNLANPHTRRAYARACRSFFQWCGKRGLRIETIRPHDVSAYVQTMSGELSAPSVRQSLAAIRMLFDWLVEGRIVFANPGSSVRGPKAPADGATISVLTAAEWRLLVDRIPDTTLRDLRDRALITTLTYTFARISAALALRVEDFRRQRDGWELWLHEKQGRRHACPCHRDLVEALHRYIEAAEPAGDGSSYLFRTGRGRCGGDTVRAADDAGRCLAHDPAPRARGRLYRPDRMPHLPCHRNRHLSGQWRHARECTNSGWASKPAHHETLRSHPEIALG